MFRQSIIEKIKKRQVINIGFQHHTPPFSYSYDGKSEPIGYSVDLGMLLIDHISQKYGVKSPEIRAIEVTSATRQKFLEEGIIDIECGSTSITNERKKLCRFSKPVFYTSHRILINKEALDDNGKPEGILNITGIRNSTSHNALISNMDIRLPYRFTGCTDILSVFEAFQLDDQIDAMIADETILKGLIGQSGISDIVMLPDRIGEEPYGFMIRLEEAEFNTHIDEALSNIMQSAQFEEIYARWFSEMIPGPGFSLNMPLTREALAKLTDQDITTL